MFTAVRTIGVKQEIAAIKSKEFLSLEGLLFIVQAAKDNLNPKNFAIKLPKHLNL
jgi:hypothetical protein